MKKLLYLILLLSTFNVFAQPQTSTISGVYCDTLTNEPVTVKLVDGLLCDCTKFVDGSLVVDQACTNVGVCRDCNPKVVDVETYFDKQYGYLIENQLWQSYLDCGGVISYINPTGDTVLINETTIVEGWTFANPECVDFTQCGTEAACLYSGSVPDGNTLVLIDTCITLKEFVYRDTCSTEETCILKSKDETGIYVQHNLLGQQVKDCKENCIPTGVELCYIDKKGIPYDVTTYLRADKSLMYVDKCTGDEINVKTLIKIDCECQVSSLDVQLCCDATNTNWIRTIIDISGCAEEGRIETDYNLAGVEIPDVVCADDLEYPCDGLGVTCEYVCYMCTDFAPVIDGTKDEVEIIKEIESIKQVLSVRSKTLTKKETRKLQEKKNELSAKLKVRAISVKPIFPCKEGDKKQVKFCGGSVVEVDGEATTVVDTTGFKRLPNCEIQVCVPDQTVKVVGDVSIDWSPICDTVVCEVVTQPEQTEFLPTGIELNVWSQSYNGGILDEDNPLLIGETYVPSVNQNLHALFNLNLPDCAVIDSSYILYDHEGSSGTVYTAINTGTNALVPNSFNSGVSTLNWAWHAGNSNTCTVFGTQYERIEGIDYPCGTTRPLRFVSRMDLTASVDDLNNLSVTSVYANANVDIYHSIKLNVFYTLPGGCQLLDENGEPIASGEGEVKVLNTQIIAQKMPLEVFGTVTVEQPCNNSVFSESFCLGVDIPEYGLVAGTDYVTLLGEKDCEGNTLGGSYYTIDLQTSIEGVEVIIDANCVAPETQSIQKCVEDEKGVQWQQFITTLGSDVLSVYFVSSNPIMTSLDIGKNTPCPIPTTNFTKNKTCAIVKGQDITGYEITYMDNGKPISIFEDLDGNQYTEYDEYCCDDCIQVAGCFDPRFVRFTSIDIGGQIVDLTAVNGGVNMTNSDVVNYMSTNYNGLFESNTVFGSNYTGCASIDIWEFVFTNSIEVSTITGIAGGTPISFNFNQIGMCSFQNKTASIIDCSEPSLNVCDFQNVKETLCPNQGQFYVTGGNSVYAFDINTDDCVYQEFLDIDNGNQPKCEWVALSFETLQPFTLGWEQKTLFFSANQLTGDLPINTIPQTDQSVNYRLAVINPCPDFVINANSLGYEVGQNNRLQFDQYPTSNGLTQIPIQYRNATITCYNIIDATEEVQVEPLFAQFTVGKYDSLMLVESQNQTILLQAILDKDCTGESGGITVTTNDIGVDFAFANQDANTTNDAFNTTINRTGTGRYTVTFATANPTNTYPVLFGQEEPFNTRDAVDPHVVEGSKTVNGFQVWIGTGDNGGGADVLVDEPWSFSVPISYTVVTGVQSN